MSDHIEIKDFTEWKSAEGYDDFVEKMVDLISKTDETVFAFDTRKYFNDYYIAYQKRGRGWLLFTDDSDVIAFGSLRDVLEKLYNIQGRFILKAKATVGFKIVFEK